MCRDRAICSLLASPRNNIQKNNRKNKYCRKNSRKKIATRKSSETKKKLKQKRTKNKECPPYGCIYFVYIGVCDAMCMPCASVSVFVSVPCVPRMFCFSLFFSALDFLRNQSRALNHISACKHTQARTHSHPPTSLNLLSLSLSLSLLPNNIHRSVRLLLSTSPASCELFLVICLPALG